MKALCENAQSPFSLFLFFCPVLMDMLHGDYDIESINSNEVGDDSSIGWFDYPDDYFVSGIKFKCNDSREGYGKELYGGVHRNEYLICTWKNGKKNGEGLLYDQYGELEFRGSFQDDLLEGEGYYYRDGAVAYKVFFTQNKRDPSMYIRYTDTSTIMVEYNGDGSLSYRGGFNDDRQREGYGAEYDKGQLSCYGLYENNVSIQRLKTFSGNIMREYHSDNDDEIIYIGEYSNCIEKGFPREGEGREFADHCLLFHGFYKDNKRHGKGTCFYAHGVARMKGVWENGKCIEEKELDSCGFYKKVEYDGHSTNSIHIINDQIILNPRIVDFIIGEKMCNGEEIQKLILRDMESIETITVGNHCFSNVSLCDIGSLPNLKSIKIGRDSFTACDRNDNKPCDGCNKDLCKEMDAKCFIANCPCLEIIKIDEGAFSSFCELSLKSEFFSSLLLRSSDVGYIENWYSKYSSWRVGNSLLLFLLVNQIQFTRFPIFIIC